MDSLKNFAIGIVALGYDASATTVVLVSGHGARFPSTAFYGVWWNATDYPNPADDPNVEIVRVTARSTDTLTITRAQEGTSATTKNTAGKTYKMMQAVTAALLGQAAPAAIELNAQTGTTYTLVASDARKLVTMSNAAANTLTVPPNSSVAIDVGESVLVQQLGAGSTAIAAGSGVTIQSRAGALTLAGQYAMAALVKVATDTWVLSGDVTP